MLWRPYSRAKSVLEIDPQKLLEHGFSTALLDLDATLTIYRWGTFPTPIKLWLERAHQTNGLSVSIVSSIKVLPQVA